MKKSIVLVLALLLLAAPALAQDAPARFYEVVRALYAKAGNPGTDDTIRVVNFQVAEQMAFEFPGQGWGMKSAAPDRPPSKGCTARVAEARADGTIVRGVCYDWITNNSTIVQPALLNDIPGQHFIPVTPRDHLGGNPPPPPPPTGDLEARIAALEKRVAALEAGGPPPPPPGGSGDALAIAKEQLETTKQILELLKKTAARFGVQ